MDEKEEIKKIVSDIIFSGYGTTVIEKFNKRWKFKTLNTEEHQRLFTIATLDEDDEVNWLQYKSEMIKMALISIDDIIPSEKAKDDLVDKLPLNVLNELYIEYKKIDDVQVNALSDISLIEDIVHNSNFSKIRYKVLSKIGALPTEKRVQDMNEYQWIWLYQNILEEEKEQEENMKVRMDYLAFYINPELSKQVREHEKQQTNSKDGIVRVKKHEEVNPYNPNEVISYGDTTVDEDFDAKLAMFMEDEDVTVLDDDKSKGNAYETKEDFLSRVAENVDYVKQYNSSILSKTEQRNQDEFEDDGNDLIFVK